MLTSVYFMMTTLTTVGYGDILPINRSEFILAMVVMLVGVGVFGFIMGTINSGIA